MAAILAALCLLALTPRAEAASDELVAILGQQECPELAIPNPREFTQREIDRAMNGWYTLAGERTKIVPGRDWGSEEDAGRVFQRDLHNFRWMNVLFYAYEQGDRRALLQARRIMVDWVKENPLGETGTPILAWQNLVAGDRAAFLGFVTRASACEGMLPARPAEMLLDSMLAHGDYLSTGGGYFESNHGLFTDLGLYLLATRYFQFHAQAQGWAQLAAERFPQTLAGRTSAEGVWLEHSAGYQFLAIRLAKRYLSFRGTDQAVADAILRLEATAPWFVAPDGKTPLIGDTEEERVEPEYRKAAKELDGMAAFPDAGYAVVRKNKSYFAATAGYHNGSHKHADDASFELHDNEVRVLTGAGKYGFDRNDLRVFNISNAASSTLTVDDAPVADRRHRCLRERPPRHRHGRIELVRRPRPQSAGRGSGRGPHPPVPLPPEDRPGDPRRADLGDGAQIPPLPPVRPRGRRDEDRPLDLLALGAERVHRLRAGRGGWGNRVEGRGLRGRPENPLRGFYFPKQEIPVERSTVRFQSTGSNVEHLLAVGLDQGCPVRLERVAGGGILDFNLLREGRETLNISVTQSGGALAVTETKLP